MFYLRSHCIGLPCVRVVRLIVFACVYWTFALFARLLFRNIFFAFHFIFILFNNLLFVLSGFSIAFFNVLGSVSLCTPSKWHQTDASVCALNEFSFSVDLLLLLPPMSLSTMVHRVRRCQYTRYPLSLSLCYFLQFIFRLFLINGMLLMWLWIHFVFIVSFCGRAVAAWLAHGYAQHINADSQVARTPLTNVDGRADIVDYFHRNGIVDFALFFPFLHFDFRNHIMNREHFCESTFFAAEILSNANTWMVAHDRCERTSADEWGCEAH